MSDAVEECMLCRPEIADAFFTRVRLWEDEYWRLSAVLQGAIPGFAHLETRRHIPFITDLDGPEAATLGPVLAWATRVLREAAGAELTYVYVFGERTPHLHFNLAPHRDGDGLRGGPGLLDPTVPDTDPAVHRAVADAAARAMADASPGQSQATPSGSQLTSLASRHVAFCTSDGVVRHQLPARSGPVV